ncbi:MAG: hypothetical protein MPJ82_03165, partial [Alphaproteobacteria bacterium]|nr:hypothetical protein [Alphaproteobacteria bacterium]MDA7988870.1 hypothetical protein [Alphaproteobacteria bacterium]MDA8009344.1 hypothetical protein [Alphaproteobacteria bacterium]
SYNTPAIAEGFAGMRKSDMASQSRQIEETLYEISVSGVFYGLGALSETILRHLERTRRSPESVVLGAALVRIAGGMPAEATRLLESSESPEARVVRALALKRSGSREHGERVLDSIPADASESVRAMVEAVRAS